MTTKPKVGGHDVAERWMRPPDARLTVLSACGFLLVFVLMGAAAAILFVESPHPISVQMESLNERALPP